MRRIWPDKKESQFLLRTSRVGEELVITQGPEDFPIFHTPWRGRYPDSAHPESRGLQRRLGDKNAMILTTKSLKGDSVSLGYVSLTPRRIENYGGREVWKKGEKWWSQLEIYTFGYLKLRATRIDAEEKGEEATGTPLNGNSPKE